MKKYLKFAAVAFGLLSSVANAENIVCSVGDGKEASTPKVISASLDKSKAASIDQAIGDFRVMAFWIPELNSVTIGVIEQTNGITASTILKNGAGGLFVSKNGQTVDLNCTVK